MTLKELLDKQKDLGKACKLALDNYSFFNKERNLEQSKYWSERFEDLNSQYAVVSKEIDERFNELSFDNEEEAISTVDSVTLQLNGEELSCISRALTVYGKNLLEIWVPGPMYKANENILNKINEAWKQIDPEEVPF